MNPAFAIIFIIIVVAIWFFLKKVYWSVGKRVSKEVEDFDFQVNSFEVNTYVKEEKEEDNGRL